MNTPKKILIAEDELNLRKPIAIALKEAGYSIIEAEDGKRALDLALKERPDLIILDIAMPEMDGLEVLAALRKDEWGKAAHVIIFTNHNDMDKIAIAAEYNVNEYIVKSDTGLDKIVEKIRVALE